jgi:hypothetical protein
MHYEALTENGKKLFPKLAEFPDFYLAGGTALAFQIGHRVSVDFDLFIGGKIKKTLLAKVEEVFSKCTREILVNNSNELTLLADSVKITFLSYPFPVLLPFEKQKGINFLGIKEIGATKAYTIGRRGQIKDYIDVYFILKEQHATLLEIMEFAEKRYGEAFDRRLFLEQLLFLDDIEDAKISFLRDPIDKNGLKEFFESEVRKIQL